VPPGQVPEYPLTHVSSGMNFEDFAKGKEEEWKKY
jgi:hypothetical protein